MIAGRTPISRFLVVGANHGPARRRHGSGGKMIVYGIVGCQELEPIFLRVTETVWGPFLSFKARTNIPAQTWCHCRGFLDPQGSSGANGEFATLIEAPSDARTAIEAQFFDKIAGQGLNEPTQKSQIHQHQCHGFNIRHYACSPGQRALVKTIDSEAERKLPGGQQYAEQQAYPVCQRKRYSGDFRFSASISANAQHADGPPICGGQYQTDAAFFQASASNRRDHQRADSGSAIQIICPDSDRVEVVQQFSTCCLPLTQCFRRQIIIP